MFVTGYGGSLFNKHDPYEKDDEEADQIYQVTIYIIISKVPYKVFSFRDVT